MRPRVLSPCHIPKNKTEIKQKTVKIIAIMKRCEPGVANFVFNGPSEDVECVLGTCTCGNFEVGV